MRILELSKWKQKLGLKDQSTGDLQLRWKHRTVAARRAKRLELAGRERRYAKAAGKKVKVKGVGGKVHTSRSARHKAQARQWLKKKESMRVIVVRNFSEIAPLIATGARMAAGSVIGSQVKKKVFGSSKSGSFKKPIKVTK